MWKESITVNVSKIDSSSKELAVAASFAFSLPEPSEGDV